MTIRTPVRKMPLAKEKRSTKKADTGKLHPKKEPDAKVRHGVWSLDKLLREDLDGRLKITKERDRLEAELIDHAGGPEALTPTITILIKEIVHKSLIASQAEKAALLGMFNLSDKHYLALSNSLRLDIQTLEAMLRQKRPKALKTLGQYLDETYRTDDK
jgi:hypothetical protein